MLEQYLVHVRDPINVGFHLGSSEIWHVIRSSYFSRIGGLSVVSAGSTNLPVPWPIAAWYRFVAQGNSAANCWSRSWQGHLLLCYSSSLGKRAGQRCSSNSDWKRQEWTREPSWSRSERVVFLWVAVEGGLRKGDTLERDAGCRTCRIHL